MRKLFPLFIILMFAPLLAYPLAAQSSDAPLSQKIDRLFSGAIQEISEVLELAMDIIITQQEEIVKLSNENIKLLEEIDAMRSEREQIFQKCEEYIHRQKGILDKAREFFNVQAGISYHGQLNFMPEININVHYKWLAIQGGFGYNLYTMSPNPYVGIFFRF